MKALQLGFSERRREKGAYKNIPHLVPSKREKKLFEDAEMKHLDENRCVDLVF